MRKDTMRKSLRYILAVGCLALAMAVLNFLFSLIMRKAGIPLYLDCIGTVVAALLGGPLPAVLTAVLTGMLNGLLDSVSVYYSIVGALIGVAVSAFAKRGYLRSIRRAWIVWLTAALIGTVLSTILTWFLYAFDYGESVSAPLTKWIISHSSMPKFLCQFLSDAAINFTDKAIALVMALGIVSLLPPAFRAKTAIYLERENAEKQAPRRIDWIKWD